MTRSARVSSGAVRLVREWSNIAERAGDRNADPPAEIAERVHGINGGVAEFREPGPLERTFNRVFGLLVGLGLALDHNYLIETRGRTTGRVQTTPVNVLDLGRRRFVVAPRGRTQWVRNAEVAGEVTLKRGAQRRRFRVRPLRDEEKPDVLREYLDRYRTTVQRYFPVRAGSGPEAFAAIASDYPVFELEEVA